MHDRAGGRVLITGAAGGLGQRLVRRYLEAGEEHLLLWLHASDRAELRAKEQALRSGLPPEAAERVCCSGGDLRDEEPFSGIDPTAIASIVHCAAVTRFNVDRDLAQRVNVAGTLKLLDFARLCPNLERIALVSSVYAAGLRTGDVAEEPFYLSGFANHYEWSKWQCERALFDRYSALPWQILRIAMVIADDASGRVCQQNAFHNTLKLVYYGLLSLVPGDRGAPVYFVTMEFAADAIHALSKSGGDQAIYHVCHSGRHSALLEELVEIAFERFEREEDFRARRILRPLFCDAETFDLLAEGVDGFGGRVVTQGLRSVKPFARQLFAPKFFSNEKLVASYERYAPPDTRALIANACDYLVRTRWDRRAGGAV